MITPIGEVDMLTAPVLAECAAAELAAWHRNVVVDLSRLSFLGSSGLAVLINTADQASTRRVELRLVAGATCAAARALDLTGLRHTFPVNGSVPAALSDGLAR